MILGFPFIPFMELDLFQKLILLIIHKNTVRIFIEAHG
jgi:hypothetical protein